MPTQLSTGICFAEKREVTIPKKSEKIGGEGKVLQIGESKVGKRKYHRGHSVEGQWVFGGIEEDSRRCFLVAVEDRSEATLAYHKRLDRTGNINCL